ncbi:mechanosensitive ion channel family protein [Thalassobaculum sp.]|uniref:mechanosensitive ion channel family protein n=1 Tax=Thalassobaculum sp. TaxID=2022740 RepID=UPI0032EE4026
MRRFFQLTQLSLAVLLMSCLASVAAAQIVPRTAGAAEVAAALPDPLTPEAVREMVSQLSDEQVRAMLLERLDAVAKTTEAGTGPGFLQWARTAVQGVLGNIAEAFRQLPNLGRNASILWTEFVGPRGPSGLALLSGWLAATIAAGLAVEAVVRRAVRRWRRHDPPSTGFRDSVTTLGRRFAVDSVGLVGFYIGAWIVVDRVIPGDSIHPFVPDITSKFIEFLVFNVVIYTRVAAMIARFVLAPQDKSIRLVPMECDDAKFLYRSIVMIGAFWGLTGFLRPFFPTHGVPESAFRIQFWLHLLLYGWMFWTIWRSRYALTRMLITGPEDRNSSAERLIAQIYPYFAMVLIVLNWFVVEYIHSQDWGGDLLDGRQNTTLLTLIFAPALDGAIRGLVRHLVPPMTGEGALAEHAHEQTKRSYIRIGRVIVFGLVILFVTRQWGFSFTNIAEAGVGARAALKLVEVLLILAVGYLLWETTTLWANRRLAAEQTALGFDPNEDEPGGGEGGGAGGSRLATILPLVLLTLQSAIIAITLLIALGNIGIDITPLLAGAGIVGLAVGFGAQKLVADIVSGVFFLIDDAFRTGEYVEVEGTFGTVEKISIRSMQLRHHKGPVHTIPYGEIPKITNYSRDWVIMKLRFTVPFDTDPNVVKKIFKQIGEDMSRVPEFAQDILQPFKSQGVLDFNDVGMIVRGKFMAKPGKQFTLRKEVFQRVKAAFAAKGIEFARREVRVSIPGLDQAEKLTDDERTAIAAAATDAARRSDEGAP